MTPIFVVVGPPAVGKSTTSRALAASYPRGLHIPVDDLRTMVVAGLALPAAEWSADLIEQVSLARASAAHMALAYHTAGFTVVIDDFRDANHYADYQALRHVSQLHRVILYPGQEQAHRRNLQRSGASPARAYIDEGIRIVYQQLAPAIPQFAREGWVVVDTTALSVEAVVATIRQRTAGEV